MNPFFSIWYKPRETFLYVRDKFPAVYARNITITGALAIGFSDPLLVRQMFQQPLPVKVLYSLLQAGIFWAVIWVIYPKVLEVVGRHMGGKGNLQDLQIAQGWLCIPSIFFALLTFPVKIATYGDGFYRPIMSYSMDKTLFQFFAFAELAIDIWEFILAVIIISEIHRFSNVKSIGCNIGASFIIVLPFILMLMLFNL